MISQEARVSDIITSIAEDLSADESDPEAVQSFTERLSELAEEPVNLNSADAEELSRLFFLTDFQIKALADYSHSTGKILSVYEIVNIPGFNRETAEMIIPFITLEKSFTQPARDTSTISALHHSLLSNFILRSDADTSLCGSNLKFLTRYKFTSGGFSGGMTIEKDAGEEFITGNTGLPDFCSSHMSYTGKGFIRKIIIGDFSARFGQGLSTNTGIRSGLSLTSSSYLAARNEIRQYTSTDENSFFRGAAASFGINNLSWTIFWSKNRIDATLTETSDEIGNLYTSGLHTTKTLLLKKDAVTDLSYGINLTYNFKNLSVGTIVTEDHFSLPFSGKGDSPDELFDFQGNRNNLYSLYYNTLINKMMLFGEISFDADADYALVQGASMRLSDRLTVNGLFRSYQNGYFSFHGKGPGGSSGNEISILGNFTFEAAKHLFVSAGCDYRRYPWLRYRCSSPSYSLRQEVRVKYLPVENLSAEALFNHRISTSDDPESTGVPSLEETISDYGRLSVRYSPVEKITLTTRLDYKVAAHEKGMMLSQDVSYRFGRIPLTCWFRLSLFSTGSWDARLYAYENDLLYSFSIPALSGRGNRSYLMLKYELNDFAEFRIKYGITSLKEDNKEEIKFQVRMFF